MQKGTRDAPFRLFGYGDAASAVAASSSCSMERTLLAEFRGCPGGHVQFWRAGRRGPERCLLCLKWRWSRASPWSA